MTRVLVTGDGYAPALLERLTDAGLDVVHCVEPSRQELADVLPDVAGYVLGGPERLDEALLEAASTLRVISFVGTGVGAFVDVDAAGALGIELRTTAGLNAAAVAEHTVGLILGTVRGLFAHAAGARDGAIRVDATDELHTLDIGLVGMGAIARRVATALVEGLGCSVTYANRTRRPEVESDLGLRHRSLSEVLSSSDVVVLLVATTPDTEGMLDEAALRTARPGMVLVNTASASLVDPTALRAALLQGTVRTAAFDGYWQEPLPSPSEDPFGLLRLPADQFVVTPHVAARTRGGWERMVAMAVEQVIDALGASASTKDGEGSR